MQGQRVSVILVSESLVTHMGILAREQLSKWLISGQRRRAKVTPEISHKLFRALYSTLSLRLNPALHVSAVIVRGLICRTSVHLTGSGEIVNQSRKHRWRRFAYYLRRDDSSRFLSVISQGIVRALAFCVQSLPKRMLQMDMKCT